MGKVKERKSESWKPTMVQDSSFISKNKKRKERRMSQVDPSSTVNLKELTESVKQKSKENGPEAKAGLLKSKGKANQSFSLTSKNKKKDIESLSVSLPIGVGKSKKENQSFSKKTKLPGILTNNDTPRRKINNKVTFKNSPKSEKLIDDEAVEMEEPITDKEIKPFPTKKGKKLPEFVASSDSDDDGFSKDELLDMQASEGEETDDETDDSNDKNSNENSDAEEEMSDMSDFLVGDDESEEGDSDQDETDKDDEDDEDNKTVEVVKSTPKQKGKKGKMQTSELVEPKKPTAATEKEIAVPKQEQTSNQLSKKDRKQSSVEKNKMKSNDIEANKENLESGQTKKVSEFVGFIGGLPENISEKQIKSALSKSVNVNDILLLTLRKCNKPKNHRICLVYVKDEDTLNVLMNVQYETNGVNFTVSRARESKQQGKGKFMAFLPRVPISISDDSIKQAIIKELGTDSILNYKSGKVYDKFQTRNLLVELASLELLKKLILKEECVVAGQSIVVREAFEAGGLSIPFYRVVFSDLPENITVPTLKKTIEAKTGKDTVLNIRFSLRKKTYAFVSFSNEEAQKQALEAGNEMSLDGKQLKVFKFIPRKPHKRGSRKSKAKNSEPKQKDQKRKMNSDDSENSPKKAKQENAAKSKKAKNVNKSVSNESPSTNVNEKKQKKKEKKAKNTEIVNKKEVKTPQAVDKKEIKKKALTEKIETKKNKLKEKKNKKKAGKSD